MSLPKETYSIQPITRPDLPTLGALLHASKQPLTINRLLFKDWPNEEKQKAIYSGTVEYNFDKPDMQTWKAVHESTGEMVGYVVLGRKKAADITSDGPNEESKGEGVVPDGMVAQVFHGVMGALKKIDAKLPRSDHFQLVHINLTPSHRGNGIGTRLLNLCIEKAKAEGLPLTATSEPQVHSFLLKFGFRDVEHADMDLAKWAEGELCGFGLFRLWGMVLS